jgi:hypothetical protein
MDVLLYFFLRSVPSLFVLPNIEIVIFETD